MNCNEKLGRSLIVAFFLGVCLTSSVNALAGDSTVLNVGDKIPELKYDKWLKGAPIKSYEKGRLYIFEFWATWCGPCRASMPHLSEVAEKYKDNLTVVGVDIWESSGGHTPTTTPDKFVKMNTNNMRYNVVTDTKDEWMGNKWMKAAGQDGIPCSFMVKDGIILWIGHPINLDSVIDVVNSGKYDPVAVQAEFKKKAAAQAAQEAKMHSILDPIDSADKHGAYAKELELIEQAKIDMPELVQYMNFKRFWTLIDHVDEDSAMTFLKRWQADPSAQFVASSAAVINEKTGHKKETYLYAVSLSEKAMDAAVKQGAPASLFQEMMAKGYAMAGDYRKAIDVLQIAYDDSKKALAEGKYKGMIDQDGIDKMEKELKEYKSHL